MEDVRSTSTFGVPRLPAAARTGESFEAWRTRAQATAPRLAARALWLFIICSVAGLLVETVFHLAVYGELQDRAGLLFGPFSPIYGVGGICISLVAGALRDKPLVVLFVVFAAVGGAVEFAVSWFLQSAFGILAWDYTGTLLSIDGRTNLPFMIAWGALGIACTKLLLPLFDRRVCTVVERMPRCLNAVIGAFMALNVALTLMAFNCWFLRMDGHEPSTPIQTACAQIFDDEFMESRFQTMSLHPGDAAR